MSNIFDAMREAVSGAEMTLRAADNVATDLAYVLRGRLRQVKRTDHLRALKKELARFNSHTGEWSEDR